MPTMFVTSGSSNMSSHDPEALPAGAGLRTLPIVKSDRDRAAEARAALRPLLEQCAEILNASARDGITVNFQMARDGYGRWTPGTIDCVKPL